jgi:hypothetical protein
MEFVQSAQLAQTEVYLRDRPAGWDAEEDEPAYSSHNLAVNGSSSGGALSDGGSIHGESDENVTIDASRLHMPVHRVLAALCVDSLAQLQAPFTAGSRASSVVVIGAGCCALPTYLQSQAHLANLTIHAVEPSAEVLDVAQRYFGANFTTDTGGKANFVDEQSRGCVIAHTMDGSEFLRVASVHQHDVIIIDAFADTQRADSNTGRNGGEDDTLSWGLCAPPQALLQDWLQLHAALTRDTASPPGLLLMNVYGPAEWVNHVSKLVQESGLFDAPTRHAVAGQEGRASETVTDAPGAGNANVVLAVVPKVNR